MFTAVLLLVLLLLNLISEGRNHIGEPCNKIIRICLPSNSYCDDENICRCKENFPVNISPHVCKKGKQHGEKCEYTEECTFFDPNSYCTQLSYRSICECHSGFIYNDRKKLCLKVGGDRSEPPSSSFPIVFGVSITFASALCILVLAWHNCKRRNFYHCIFNSRNTSDHSQYFETRTQSQADIPSAPPIEDETLPNYDVALTLKDSEDCDPPPSYQDVVNQEQISKA